MGRRFLEAEGIVILRFENRILYQNIEAVLETIREAVRKRVADHPRRADHWRQHDNLGSARRPLLQEGIMASCCFLPLPANG